MDDKRNGLELDWTQKRATLYGQNLINLLTLVGVCLLIAGFYMEYEETKTVRADAIASIRALARAQEESNSLARERNCLISLPESERTPQRIQWCREQSR